MKVTLNANQLTDATIQSVSLVKHGANRTPFKILKAEPLPEDGSLNKVAASVRKLFDATAPAPVITAVYVNKTSAKTAFPILKDAGFRVEAGSADLLDGVVVLKQEGYDANATEGSVVALSPEVAVQFDRVMKDYCSWSCSTDFSENLKNLGFYPGTWMAFDTLRETIYQIMSEAHTPEEASGPLDAALKAFSKHVLGLAKSLPAAVFKAEQKLASGFEGPTVASTDPVSKSEGADMSKTAAVLREAVAGDLAGLFSVEKSEADVAAEAAAATAAADAAALEAKTAADAAATAAAAAKPAGEATTDTPATDAPTGDAVEKGEPTMLDVVKALKDTLGPMAKAIQDLTKNQTETQAALTARLDAIEKKADEAVTAAKTAVTKADNTVLVHADNIGLDGTMATMGGQARVTKSNAGTQSDNVFRGLLPGFDALEDRLNGNS